MSSSPKAADEIDAGARIFDLIQETLDSRVSATWDYDAEEFLRAYPGLTFRVAYSGRVYVVSVGRGGSSLGSGTGPSMGAAVTVAISEAQRVLGREVGTK